jgi:hypothetical protein
LRKFLFPLVAALALFLPAGAHAYCYGWNEMISPLTPNGNVCGTVDTLGYNGSTFVTRTPIRAYVKICPAGYPSSSMSCSTTSTSPYSTYDNQPVQAFNFPYYRQGNSNYANFDFYVWAYSSSEYWGSSSWPITRRSIGPGLEGISLYMPPRPLKPNPIYPSGTSVPSSYTVRWFSGIDIDRSPYPVTYDVYYKYWSFGETEPVSWTPSRTNMPCHDDGSGPTVNGECSTYVVGPQPAGNWKWYVVANLNVSSQVYSGYSTTYFTTQSGWIAFTQPQ